MILCFGLIRPYKGVDVLLEAFRELEGAELWIVGMPRMDLGAAASALRRALPGTVRFVDRFITDPEIPAYFRRADVVALPVPRDRAVRRPLHGARLRQADRRQRDRRLHRGRRARRRAAAGRRPATRAALAAALAELLADPARARDAGRRGGAPPRPAPYSWDDDRRAHARRLPRRSSRG